MDNKHILLQIEECDGRMKLDKTKLNKFIKKQDLLSNIISKKQKKWTRVKN